MKTPLVKSVLLMTGLFFCISLVAQEKKKPDEPPLIPLSEMQEFHKREGLPNIFQKIATQRQVRIGYIGGSITEMPQGWRDLTFGWFRATFPLTAIYQVDATIGGTGSGLAAVRMEHDLLAGNPDLIFVEYAVNGTGVPPYNAREPMVRTIEGIVRKTWAMYPNTDICFVYTTALNMCNALVQGKPQQPSVFMEEVADYYGIPSIHMGIQVAKLLAEGKLVFKADPTENANTIVFTRDGTHALPESGQPIYASTVIRYLTEMSKQPAKKDHKLPKPMMADNWQNSKMVDVSETKMSGEWTKLPENHDLSVKFQRFMPSIYQAKPGSVMSFKFKGKVLGIYDCIGPGSGNIEITIDGQKEVIFRFDQWCDNYRKNNFFMKEMEDKVHEVSVRVLNEPIDKAAIMLKKKITITDPAKYAGLDWYPANIMIVGDLIK
ncbi:MAG: SGNH/GDSL hydrolase family protein [Bacteroidales bacterium]|nr:SGNH/GDSL hydrolase family protein [Bacteroidales bacterium]